MPSEFELRHIEEQLGKDINLDPEVEINDDSEIGSGSYGTVFRGSYRESDVCVKVLKEVAWDPKSNFILRLLREVKIWRQLVHQHVVRFRGWALHAKHEKIPEPSLVSDWCKHGPVNQFLGLRTDANRINLIRGIAEGLNYLHSMGIVHGDLKPDNVVVDPSEEAQLCDFGASCILSDESTHLHFGNSSMGAFRYVAPEFMEPEEPFRNKATDVWSFGCTAMEIFHKRFPYFSRTVLAVPMAIMRKIPPFELSPNPSTIEQAITKCFAYEPKCRPSMSALISKFNQKSVGSPEIFLGILKEVRDGDPLNLEHHVEVVRENANCKLYKGSHKRLQNVRVKVLPNVTVSDEKMLSTFLRRFVAEVKKWNCSNLSLVAETHGWILGMDRDQCLHASLVSAWSSKGDIKNYLSDSENSKADRRKLVRDICAGLRSLHMVEIIHGNIKPGNILINSNGSAVLCDYGLPTLLCDMSVELRNVRYAAPELLGPDAVSRCSEESDIWAFGCVSIEIISDEAPYHEIEDAKLCERIASSIPYNQEILNKNKGLGGCLKLSPGHRCTLENVLIVLNGQTSDSVLSDKV